jgi:uncharacterized protein
MAVDHIRYDILAQEALRGVVRTVLTDAAKNGLPGEHHFYISFDTRAEGVRLSPRMLAEYPNEITIVLQHQFWDLVVTEEGFEVGMSFGGVPERVAVPFAAIKGFLDPSVEFGLRFEEVGSAQDGADIGAGSAATDATPNPKTSAPKTSDKASDKTSERPAAEHKGSRAPLAAVPSPANPAPTEGKPGDGPDKPPGGGEVVRLDRFRKK